MYVYSPSSRTHNTYIKPNTKKKQKKTHWRAKVQIGRHISFCLPANLIKMKSCR